MADLERLKPAPMIPIAAATVAGIVLMNLIGSIWVSIGICVLGLAFCISKKYLYAAWTIAAAIGSASFWVATGVDEPENVPAIGTERVYYAHIGSTRLNDNSLSADVEIIKSGVSPDGLSACRHIKTRLILPTDYEDISGGSDIIFHGELQPAIPRLDLPDELDPAQNLLRRHIRYVCYVMPDDVVSVSESNTINGKMLRLREDIVEKIYQSRISPDAKIFIAVALLGYDADMTTDTRRVFAAAGISHILALSGLHVGIIAFIITFALWPLRIFGRRNLIAIVTIALLWFYACLTGLSPSVSRATIMASIYLLGGILQRDSSSFNSLALAAFLILIFDPEALFAPGFQLSFCAVATIIMFADRINPIKRSRKRKMLYAFTSYLSVSICAMIGTAVPAAYYFHVVPFYFIGANIIASLILPFLIGGAVVLIVFELFGFDPIWLCRSLDLLYKAIVRSAEFFGSLPGALLQNLYLTNWLPLIYGLTIIALYFWMIKRSIRRCAIFLLLAVTCFGMIIFAPEVDRQPRLYVARNSYRTDVIIDNATSTLFIRSSKPQEYLDIASRAKYRYGDYMGIRNIDSLCVDTAFRSVHQGFDIEGPIIRFGRKNIALISSDKDAERIKGNVSNAIVCRGYKGDMQAIIEHLHPDTIILSSDLHPRRRMRYVDECTAAGTPCIDMSATGWNTAP